MDDIRVRIEWKESKGKELFLIIAEKHAGEWKFFERSTWEVRWSPIPSNPRLMNELTRVLKEAKPMPSDVVWGCVPRPHYGYATVPSISLELSHLEEV